MKQLMNIKTGRHMGLPLLLLLFLTGCATVKAPVTKSERGLNFTQAIYFDFDRWTLSEDATKLVRSYALQIASDRIPLLLLEGYTDPIGPDDYNKRLGDLRARAVKVVLIQAGIDPARLLIASHGEVRGPGLKLKRYALERRVEIRVVR